MSGFTVGALLLAILSFGVSGEEAQKGVEGPVFISEPPANRRFSNNTGTMVHCTAFGNPPPVLEWIKSDGRLVENIEGVVQVKSNSSLYFPPFADDKFRPDVHMAKYRCVATNKAGTIWSREMSVKAVLAKTYRTYNVIVNSVFVTRGNTAVFKCTVRPYYVKEFIKVTSWLRSGKPVTPGERFRILPYGELHIRNVDVADHFQTYRCVIKNIMTNESTTSGQAALEVLEPINSAPEIEVISAIEVKEGENAELKCVANGYPIPQYNWFRDGQKIILDQKVSQFGGNLMIRKASTRDTGIYECVATNSQGTRQGRTSLLVKAPLSAFIEPSHPVIDQGRSVTINCTIYGHPVQQITWLKDGQPLVTNNRVYILKTTVLHINDLQRHDEGMYQCLVSNAGDNAQGAAQVSLGGSYLHV